MRSSSLMFALLGVAGLLTTACSPDAKTTETATTADGTTVTTTTTVDTSQYWNAVPTLSDRIVADLKLDDTVLVRRVRTVYRTRAHRLTAAEVRYTADTTGRYAALRDANDQADRELKTTLDAARYRAYEQNRAAYYEGTPYTMVVVKATPAPAPSGPAEVSREVSKDGEVKIKYADGSKMKIGADGDTKVKHADGTKVKDGDDGYKVKK